MGDNEFSTILFCRAREENSVLRTTVGWVYKHHHMLTLVRTYVMLQGISGCEGVEEVLQHHRIWCTRVYVGSCTEHPRLMYLHTHLMLNVHTRD